MFSTGQYIFAALFFIAFVIAMIFTYRKDAKLHKKNYKGSVFILLGFIAFIVFLFILKTQLN
jgi:NADH:ubiquinone oxidoreductase subunit 3 (subunit A)